MTLFFYSQLVTVWVATLKRINVHTYTLSLVPERGACAITVTEFPEYVRRMQRTENGKTSMLADEYEVSFFQ